MLVGPAAEKPNLTLVVGGPKGGQIACGKLAVKDGALMVGGASAPNPPIAFHTVAECGKWHVAVGGRVPALRSSEARTLKWRDLTIGVAEASPQTVLPS